MSYAALDSGLRTGILRPAPDQTALARVGGALVLATGGRYIIIFIWTWIQPEATQSARLLALQSQLAACKDRVDRRKSLELRFEPAFRVPWVFISKIVDGSQDLVQLMHAATVKHWHTTVF